MTNEEQRIRALEEQVNVLAKAYKKMAEANNVNGDMYFKISFAFKFYFRST